MHTALIRIQSDYWLFVGVVNRNVNKNTISLMQFKNESERGGGGATVFYISLEKLLCTW